MLRPDPFGSIPNIAKMSKTILIILIIATAVYLFNWYRQVVPERVFFLFVILMGVLIIGEIILFKIVRKKFENKPYLAKISDLLGAILFFIILYLFAIYVFPGVRI